jgi:hypothetical protein
VYPSSFCVFCLETGTLADAIHADLEDAGYTVVVVRGDGDLEEQMAQYSFWGRG